MRHKGYRRKLTFIDHLRGWHWYGAHRVRNQCGCVIWKD
jgi:hypothetical protein